MKPNYNRAPVERRVRLRKIMNTLKQIGTRVVIRAVSRPDRDGNYVGKTGEIKKFEKHRIKGVLCYLRLDDGDDFYSLIDNIDVVPNAELTGRGTGS